MTKKFKNYNLLRNKNVTVLLFEIMYLLVKTNEKIK